MPQTVLVHALVELISQLFPVITVDFFLFVLDQWETKAVAKPNSNDQFPQLVHANQVILATSSVLHNAN